MTICHVMTGLPASGKTTHARSLGVMRFSLDDFRAMCGNGKETWTDDQEGVAVTAMIESARAAIIAGESVALDNTHLVPRLPKMYRKAFASLGVTFQIHDFTFVTIDECIERDAEREIGHVGEAVIRKLAKRHMEATKNGWRLTDRWMNIAEYVMPTPYEPRPELPPIILCDIDGTVAIHGDERGHYDYDKVSGDQPNHAILDLAAAVQGEYAEVVFMSGREDRCRTDTETWLKEHWGDMNSQLFMRTTGDHRPDYIIKQELFDANIRDRYDVRFVLDDRDQVVKMWREMGLTCLQVADGNF